MLATTTARIATDVIRVWEDEQKRALREIGRPSCTTARGLVVTLTRMDIPALREWEWITGDLEWQARTFGDLRGYTVHDLDGAELGIILQRGRVTHAEWLNPATGEHEFTGEVRTLRIAANYIVDQHDGIARQAGQARPRVADDDALEQFLAPQITAAQKAAEPLPTGGWVVYTGTLAQHQGEEFILQPHHHMYEITDRDDDCACDPRNRYTLVAEGGDMALLHVSRSHFTPVG